MPQAALSQASASLPVALACNVDSTTLPESIFKLHLLTLVQTQAQTYMRMCSRTSTFHTGMWPAHCPRRKSRRSLGTRRHGSGRTPEGSWWHSAGVLVLPCSLYGQGGMEETKDQ